MDLILPWTEYNNFEQFGPWHLLAIGLLLIAVVALVLLANSLRANRIIERRVRLTLIAIMLAAQTYYYVWNFVFASDRLAQNIIPAHMCSAILVPLIWYAIKPNQYVYEVYFFWGTLGGGAAMLFPFTEGFDWPHTRVIQTVFVHALFFLMAIYFTVVDQYKMTKFSVLRAYVWTAILAGIAFVVNQFTGANYMFLGNPPAGTTTPLDLFPQNSFKYPLLLLVLLAVYFLIFGIWKLCTWRRVYPKT
ncbi:MAG: TIGR02206 family membrane protein [Bifidobacteriaceae bacterium]|jgi:hypothetical integral membrane protein (TIGR02206 family)|nr:TIGR02206 family membrane protein [Bifidobacteriaceae bacterium]